MSRRSLSALSGAILIVVLTVCPSFASEEVPPPPPTDAAVASRPPAWLIRALSWLGERFGVVVLPGVASKPVPAPAPEPGDRGGHVDPNGISAQGPAPEPPPGPEE